MIIYMLSFLTCKRVIMIWHAFENICYVIEICASIAYRSHLTNNGSTSEDLKCWICKYM